MTKVIAVTPAELEAAKLEGLAPATLGQRLLIARGRELQAQADELERQIKEIKNELDAQMAVENLRGLLAEDGTKAVERSVVAPTERFNWTKFQAQNPDVAAAWMTPKAGWTSIKLL